MPKLLLSGTITNRIITNAVYDETGIRAFGIREIIAGLNLNINDINNLTAMLTELQEENVQETAERIAGDTAEREHTDATRTELLAMILLQSQNIRLNTERIYTLENAFNTLLLRFNSLVGGNTNIIIAAPNVGPIVLGTQEPLDHIV